MGPMQERRNPLKTTVIIPNYNGIDYLENCLRSLENSFADKAPAFEVCIVDNGSVDGSPEMAEQFFPWTQIIRFPENRGFCAAINEGITRARTPYVFLLNNDTTVDPACIRRLERRMDNDPRLFSAAAKMLSMKNPDIMDGAGDRYNALGWAFAIGKGRPSTDYNTPMPIFSASAGAALYRKEYLQKTGLLDELHFAYLEDVDLGYRARILGYRNAYEPTAKVYHAGSATTGSRYNPFKITHSSRNNIYLIYKNMPLFHLILNLPFLIAGFFIKTLFFCAKGYAGVYLKGLGEGIRLCTTPEARQRKFRFKPANFGHYITIQLELWLNIFRRR